MSSDESRCQSTEYPTEGYIDEDGYAVTEWRLVDSFEIPRDVWAVIEGLRERADAAERAAVSDAMVSGAETPLPHETHAVLTVDSLHAIANLLERATRIRAEGEQWKADGSPVA